MTPFDPFTLCQSRPFAFFFQKNINRPSVKYFIVIFRDRLNVLLDFNLQKTLLTCLKQNLPTPPKFDINITLFNFEHLCELTVFLLCHFDYVIF